jgi:hypothetical protein
MGNSINDKLLPINQFKIFTQDRYPKDKEKSIKKRFKSMMSPNSNKSKILNDKSQISFNNEIPLYHHNSEEKQTIDNQEITINIDELGKNISKEIDDDNYKSNFKNFFNNSFLGKGTRAITSQQESDRSQSPSQESDMFQSPSQEEYISQSPSQEEDISQSPSSQEEKSSTNNRWF